MTKAKKATQTKRTLVSLMTIVMLLVSIFSILPTSITANATAHSEANLTYYGPNLNGNRIEAYCQSTIKVYLDSSLRTPGSKDAKGRAKYYNAYAENNDLIYIFNANSSSCYISYPVGSTRRYGYIRSSDIFLLNHSYNKTTSKAKVNTFRQSNLSTKFGEVWVGDTVFSTGIIGNSYRITYNCGGNNWKSAWVSYSDYVRICGNVRCAYSRVSYR